jgi:TrmH family RNA methyltransferase
LILTPGTTDAFAPKVVRAAMGANFRLPIQIWDWPQIHQACQTNPIGAAQLLIADSAGGTSCWEANLKRPTALVIGGEAEGAQPQLSRVRPPGFIFPCPAKRIAECAIAAEYSSSKLSVKESMKPEPSPIL